MSDKVPESFRKLMRDIGIGDIEQISVGRITYNIKNNAPIPDLWIFNTGTVK